MLKYVNIVFVVRAHNFTYSFNRMQHRLNVITIMSEQLS